MYQVAVAIAVAFGSKEGFDSWMKRLRATFKGSKGWTVKITEVTETPQRRRRS